MWSTRTVTEQVRKKGRGDGGEILVLRFDPEKARKEREAEARKQAAAKQLDARAKQALKKVHDDEERRKKESEDNARRQVAEAIAEGTRTYEERRQAQATPIYRPQRFSDPPQASQTRRVIRVTRQDLERDAMERKAEADRKREMQNWKWTEYWRKYRIRERRAWAAQGSPLPHTTPRPTTTSNDVARTTPTPPQTRLPRALPNAERDTQTTTQNPRVQTVQDILTRPEERQHTTPRSTWSALGVARQVGTQMTPVVRGIGTAALQATLATGVTAAFGLEQAGQTVGQVLGPIAAGTGRAISNIVRKRKAYQQEEEEDQYEDRLPEEQTRHVPRQDVYVEEDDYHAEDPGPSSFQRMTQTATNLARHGASTSASVARSVASTSMAVAGRVSSNVASIANSLSETINAHKQKEPLPSGVLFDEFTGEIHQPLPNERAPMDEYTGEALPQYQDLREQLDALRRQIDTSNATRASDTDNILRNINTLTTDVEDLRQSYALQEEALAQSASQVNQKLADLERRTGERQATLAAQTNALEEYQTYTQDLLNELVEKAQNDNKGDDIESSSIKNGFNPGDPDDDPSDDGKGFGGGGGAPKTKRDTLIYGRNTIIPSFDINIGIQIPRNGKKGRRSRPPQRVKKPTRGKEKLDVTRIL